MRFSSTSTGSGVEVYPAGTELQPGGSNGGGFVKKPEARGYGPTHFALSVATEADKVDAIAAREGWQCFRCNRGPFHVIEVWVENETMVEILTSPSPAPTRSPRLWPPRRRRHPANARRDFGCVAATRQAPDG